MPTRDITVYEYRNGVLVNTTTQKEEYDDVRVQALAAYANATQAVRDNTNVPLVLKAWIMALNRVLKVVIREIQE